VTDSVTGSTRAETSAKICQFAGGNLDVEFAPETNLTCGPELKSSPNFTSDCSVNPLPRKTTAASNPRHSHLGLDRTITDYSRLRYDDFSVRPRFPNFLPSP